MTDGTAGRGGTLGNTDVVVVLSYFGAQDTVECVESLVIGSRGAAVLVIDNGAFDGVLDLVRDRWPQVATLQTGENLGFAGGMNRGIRWALDAGAGTVTVLNNDTVIPAGAIEALARTARTGAAVSPEVRYADGSGRLWFAGGVIDPPTSLARHLSGEEIAAEATDQPALRPSEVLAGCCVTATAETWRRVGLFDERYFLNFEDSDWSVRATRAGVPLLVDTGVVIRHRVSASFTGSYTYLGLYYYTRNGLLFGASRRRWDVPVRLRFLRRQVVPVLGQDVRGRDFAELARHLLLVGAAILAHLVHCYGRAPRWLERLATAWSGKPKGDDSAVG